MGVDTSVIGRTSGRAVVAVERGPVSNFARAVGDRSPIYQDVRAARAAGFDDVPAPPTWPFAMAYWGTFPEQQEGLEPVTDNPMWEVMAKLGHGLILHGEQEFEYHRPIVAGDVLVGEDVIADLYEKESPGVTMTFVVTETVWRDLRSGEPVASARFNLIHRARHPDEAASGQKPVVGTGF